MFGVHAEIGTAQGAGVAFIKGDHGPAQAASGSQGIYYQDVHDHDLALRGGVLPGSAGINIYLNLVEDGGSRHLALQLLRKEVPPTQGRFPRWNAPGR